VEVDNGDTGAQSFGIIYQYAFSKRTQVKIGYSLMDNDGNSNRVRIGNTAATLRTGEKLDGWAAHIAHRF
jgi:predicted porin